MPRKKIEYGLDPSIADPDSPKYNESDPDFGIAKLMLERYRKAPSLQQGVVSLIDGIAIVPSSVVTATCAAQLTPQQPINGTVSMDDVIPGSSFTIKSTDTEDQAQVYYQLYETK